MISVLDYGIGNLRSAQKALQRVGADARLARRPEDAARASGIVLPGVGAFGACVAALHGSGLAQVAIEAARSGRRPLLGICVGFQMLFEGSDEDPEVAGLGVLRGRCRRLPDGEKHPQMQWNRLDAVRGEPSAMLAPFDEPPFMYFVHSFAPEPAAPDDQTVVATCDYGGRVVAAIERGNLWGCQFHPEKSGPSGLALMAAFARLCE